MKKMVCYKIEKALLDAVEEMSKDYRMSRTKIIELAIAYLYTEAKTKHSEKEEAP